MLRHSHIHAQSEYGNAVNIIIPQAVITLHFLVFTFHTVTIDVL